MTREEIRLQVAISVIQGVLEAKHGVIGEVVPSVAVGIALRIADAFVEEWYRETKEKKESCWSEEDSMHLKNAILSAEKEWGNESYTAKWLEFLPERFTLQPKQEWSEEDEKNIRNLESILYYDKKLSEETRVELGDFLKSLRPQPREEIYQSAKHDLAIRFMNYLDENRPEGKMCLSNGECEDIDKAFKENDWAKILRYAEKYGK